MNKNKKIIITTLLILLIIFLVYLCYFEFVRPHIVGDYEATSRDCKKAYDCTCVQDMCLCSYKRWFKENKVTCAKDTLKESQIKK